jgi:hypothetical protein
MDDPELEARLRTHLHRQLDDLDVSRDLRSRIEQGLSSADGSSRNDRRARRWMSLGFSVVAAAALLVVATIGLNLGRGPGPAGPTTTPSPASQPPSAAPTERSFIVLPPPSARPSVADATLATDVLTGRLEALGVPISGTVSSTSSILFETPDLRVNDAAVRALLAAPGAIEFVPLPPADYGTSESPGPLVAAVGAPLPKAEAALFGGEGVGTLRPTVQGPLALDIDLRPAAALAFGAYTTAHVGELFAVVVDGTVVAAPSISEPITTGKLTVSIAPAGDAGADATRSGQRAIALATVIGGELPAAWRGLSVPVVVSRAEAVAAATAATGGGNLQFAQLSGQLVKGAWRAVWNVAVDHVGCSDVSSCASDAFIVTLDATDGAVLQMRAAGG